MKVACTHCGQHLAVDDSWAGTEVNCPTCGQAFTLVAMVPEPVHPTALADAPAPPPPPPSPTPPALAALEISRSRPASSTSPTSAPKPSAGSQSWETTPAGSGKIAFLATPPRGHGLNIAVERETKARAALYGGSSFLVLVFFVKGGIYGGLAMLILVSLFLGCLKIFELLTAKHFARKMDELRKSSLNPSSFGAGFEPCPAPACDLCRTAMTAPLGHLLTTTQIVNSPAFWARYWQIHEPRIKAIGKAQGMNFVVPSFRFFASQYEQMKQLHFLFERIAANGQPWLVCDDCLRVIEANDAESSAALARQWWQAQGRFSPPEAGPAAQSDINLGSAAAQFQMVGSLTVMLVGTAPILVALTSLFEHPAGGKGPGPSVTSDVILVAIGVSLILLGRKWWKS